MTVEKIRNFVAELGITDCGFSVVSAIAGYGDLTNCITLMQPLSRAIVSQIEHTPTHEYFQHYRTVNAFLDSAALRLAAEIERSGLMALPIAASQSIPPVDAYRGLFPHKTGARLSGLGFIGKNGLLITQKYGAAVRFATVLTNLNWGIKNQPQKNGCGTCMRCVDACRAGALSGRVYEEGILRDDIVDAAKCSHYMKDHYQNIGRGSVCGACIAACPYFCK